MLHAELICSDEGCAAAFEWWGGLDDFHALACDGCGCVLVVLKLSEADPPPMPEITRPVLRAAA